MNTEIKLFKTEDNAELGITVNIYGTQDEPLFNAGEVAKLLWATNSKGYPQMTKLSKALSISKVAVAKPIKSSDYITEKQYYKAILKSGSEKAEPMYDWLSEDVLPNIRKNGGYISDNATAEQVSRLDENNLIQLANDGRKVGKRIKRIFTGLTPNEVLEKLDYIYPLINSGVRYYFLDSLYTNIIGVQKEYATQAISDGSLDTTVYDGYNKIMLFAKTEALKFKNRSDGKIIAALKKKVSKSDDVSVFEDKIKHLESRVPKIIFNQNLDELEDVYDTSNDEYRVVMTPAEGSFGPYFRFKMTEVKDTTFELECNFNQYLVTKNVKVGTHEYKVELTDTGVDLLCTVTKVYIEPTAYDMEDF